jgi:hypothetical protein
MGRSRFPSITIKRDKLLDELRKQKKKKLDEIDKRAAEHAKKMTPFRKQIATAAAKDLSQDANFEALIEAVDTHQRKDHGPGPHYRQDWADRFDNAIRTIELSSDVDFEVSMHTDLGMLIGINLY